MPEGDDGEWPVRVGASVRLEADGFALTVRADGSVWLENFAGEGMEVREFGKMLGDYFKENF